MPGKPPIALFDSSTAMVQALAHALREERFRTLGQRRGLAPLALLAGRLPEQARQTIYVWSGWLEAIPPGRLASIDTEEISRWVINQYAQRSYPAIAVGSSSGALVHLCAAFGIAWLPQTYLIPVRRTGVHPDEPGDDLEWGRRHAHALLNANPEIQLHHMHDPVQDRLMVQRMTYFRVKRLRLGPTFEAFIRERLREDGTILLVDCRLPWPTVKVGDRHFFQFGALGGATPDELLHGSERVERYLGAHGSHQRRWQAPKPDAERPEAEWGFEQSLVADVERFATARGYRVRRLRFDGPQELSPLVADLYRWWNERLGRSSRRLLVESFILLDPAWCAGAGYVPFWTVFPVEPAADAFQAYARERGPFAEAHALLFNHGVDSIGLVRPQEWRRLLADSAERSSLVAVDERQFPRDFATFGRYDRALDRLARPGTPPMELPLQDLDRFLDESKARYDVTLDG